MPHNDTAAAAPVHLLTKPGVAPAKGPHRCMLTCDTRRDHKGGYRRAKTLVLHMGHSAPRPCCLSQGCTQSAWYWWRQGRVSTMAPSSTGSRQMLHISPLSPLLLPPHSDAWPSTLPCCSLPSFPCAPACSLAAAPGAAVVAAAGLVGAVEAAGFL